MQNKTEADSIKKFHSHHPAQCQTRELFLNSLQLTQENKAQLKHALNNRDQSIKSEYAKEHKQTAAPKPPSIFISDSFSHIRSLGIQLVLQFNI
ncbi:hypothetical protein SynA18461_00387 [Synechococcus sp. A18-46.1]|nr:hypothetical protein SynA18461_00387 [Synechococcus sp. A18-46.1]